MTLIPDVKRVLRKAWSIRLVVLASVLSGCEVVMPFFVDTLPRNVFTGLAFAATVGAGIARVVAQEGVHND